MRTKRIRLGSRGSELALWQSNSVKHELEQRFRNLHFEIIIIKTTADGILRTPLSKIGGKGLFIKEIEQALLNDEIDLAVHSLKDVPTSIPEDLALGAITKREDVHDVFVAHPRKPYKSFDEVPEGGEIATGSLRRKCQLLHWRPDLQIVDIRGNLNTRFKGLEESHWDGMILARVGIVRLGWHERITEAFKLERMLPAAGQGALALEIRRSDKRIERIVGAINDEATALATQSERALLRELEGGCQIPVGTYGRIEQAQLTLDALVGSVDGRKTVRGKIHGTAQQAEDLGKRLAKTLLDSGARDILEKIRDTSSTEVPVV